MMVEESQDEIVAEFRMTNFLSSSSAVSHMIPEKGCSFIDSILAPLSSTTMSDLSLSPMSSLTRRGMFTLIGI